MNANQLAGKWKQLKGAARAKWGKLTSDDWDMVAGNRDAFIGKLQERYGIAQEEAQRRAEEWMQSLTEKDLEAESGEPHERKIA